jgi:hypothetical protein
LCLQSWAFWHLWPTTKERCCDQKFVVVAASYISTISRAFFLENNFRGDDQLADFLPNFLVLH